MTVERAIKGLKQLKKSNAFRHYLSTESPTCFSALSMAISALEKEKEPAPQKAETSSKHNNSTLKICQDIINDQIEELLGYYDCQFSDDEQEIFDKGVRYRELALVQKFLKEEGID